MNVNELFPCTIQLHSDLVLDPSCLQCADDASCGKLPKWYHGYHGYLRE